MLKLFHFCNPTYVFCIVIAPREKPLLQIFFLKSFPKAAARINFLCCPFDNVTPFLTFPLMAFAALHVSGRLVALPLGQTHYSCPSLF